VKKELNPTSKVFTPIPSLPKDRFEDSGPSENDMNVQNKIPFKTIDDKKKRSGKPHSSLKQKEKKQRSKPAIAAQKLTRF